MAECKTMTLPHFYRVSILLNVFSRINFIKWDNLNHKFSHDIGQTWHADPTRKIKSDAITGNDRLNFCRY